MAGAPTDDFLQDIAQTIQNATGAPAPLANTTAYVILYHTTLNDTVAIGDTGRMGQGSTSFTAKIANTTAQWTLAGGTSPSDFENKSNIVISTGNFSAPTETTIKSFIVTSANSTASGTVYFWGDISPTQTVSTGNTIQFSTGALSVSVGGGAGT